LLSASNLALSNNSLHLKFLVTVIKSDRVRNSWLSMNQLELRRMEHVMDLPCCWQCKAPSLSRYLSFQQERSSPFFSQLTCTQPQGQIFGRQPHLLADSKLRSTAVDIRLLFHCFGRCL